MWPDRRAGRRRTHHTRVPEWPTPRYDGVPCPPAAASTTSPAPTLGTPRPGSRLPCRCLGVSGPGNNPMWLDPGCRGPEWLIRQRRSPCGRICGAAGVPLAAPRCGLGEPLSVPPGPSTCAAGPGESEGKGWWPHGRPAPSKFGPLSRCWGNRGHGANGVGAFRNA